MKYQNLLCNPFKANKLNNSITAELVEDVNMKTTQARAPYPINRKSVKRSLNAARCELFALLIRCNINLSLARFEWNNLAIHRCFLGTQKPDDPFNSARLCRFQLIDVIVEVTPRNLHFNWRYSPLILPRIFVVLKSRLIEAVDKPKQFKISYEYREKSRVFLQGWSLML